MTSGTSFGRGALALAYGCLCHLMFAAAFAAMVLTMASGMTWGHGTVSAPACWLVNMLLLLQLPLGHSALLTGPGRRLLGRLAPAAVSTDMAPTTYVIIASAQVFLLFYCWSWSGIVWWQATNEQLLLFIPLFGLSWVLLGVSILNAGLGLQSGFIGWWAVLRGRPVAYPDMPTKGLFAVSRQPIYVAFALTTWTTPVWTPDQLLVAVTLTAYCLIGPAFKEARFRRIYGARFDTYARTVPYWLPVKVLRSERRPDHGRSGASSP